MTSMVANSLVALVIDGSHRVRRALCEQARLMEFTSFGVSRGTMAAQLLSMATHPVVLVVADPTGSEKGLVLLENSLTSYRDRLVGGIYRRKSALRSDRLIRVKDLYLDLGMPFFELSPSAPMKELRMLLAQIRIAAYGVSSSRQSVSLLQRRPKFRYLHAGNVGKILRSARRTLDFRVESIVNAMNRQGCPMDPERYRQIEAGGEGGEMSSVEWFVACDVLKLPTDSITFGYQPLTHLHRVKNAILEGQFFCSHSDFSALLKKAKEAEDAELFAHKLIFDDLSRAKSS